MTLLRDILATWIEESFPDYYVDELGTIRFKRHHGEYKWVWFGTTNQDGVQLSLVCRAIIEQNLVTGNKDIYNSYIKGRRAAILPMPTILLASDPKFFVQLSKYLLIFKRLA